MRKEPPRPQSRPLPEPAALDSSLRCLINELGSSVSRWRSLTHALPAFELRLRERQARGLQGGVTVWRRSWNWVRRVATCESESAMRSFVGLAFLAAGFGLAGYTVAPMVAPDQDELGSIARTQDAAGFGGLTPAAPAPVDNRLGAFAPRSPLFSSTSPLQPRRASAASEAQRTAATADRGPRAPALSQPEVRQAPVLVRPARSFAFVDSRRVAASATSRISFDASDGMARYRLVRDIQRELKRAGCYGGKIDGSWGAGTKRGLGEFTRRVNSVLPSHTPEPVQLALLQSHPGQVCGRECPSGRTLSASGRCIERQQFAVTTPTGKTPPLATGSTTPAASQRNLSTASAVRNATGGSTVSAGWTAKVQPPPSVIPAPRLVRVNPKPRLEPLAGQMALNGPRPADVSPRQRAPGVAALPDTSGSSASLSNPRDRDVDRRRAAERRSVKPRRVKRSSDRPRARRKAASKPRWRKNRRRYSKRVRQRRLMRQAFGDSMF